MIVPVDVREYTSMFHDALTLDLARVETDVCIIGTGPAGLTVARELIGERFRVCLLEGGGFEPDVATDSLGRAVNVGHRYDQLDLTRQRNFGGNSASWFLPVGDGLGCKFRPLDPIDFERRDAVAHSGWPFDRAHLDPYYERAQQVFGAAPPMYSAADWSADWSMDHRPLGTDEASVTSPVFQFGRVEVFGSMVRDEIDRAPNITTYLNANVVEIATDPSGASVELVRASSGVGGQRFEVAAKVFVLAAGGTENPRLLLMSNHVHREGLGNGHDNLGRYFMEHLHLWPGRLVPFDRERFDSMGLYAPHAVRDVQVMAGLAVAEPLLRREGLLNHCVLLTPDAWSEGVRSLAFLRAAARQKTWPDELGRHLGNLVAEPRQLSRAVIRRLRHNSSPAVSAPPQVFLLSTMSEQAPNPDSRVRLSGQLDELGTPRVALDWRLGSGDFESLTRANEIIDHELQRCGVGRLVIDQECFGAVHGGWHHMGTTRMHQDPRRGVVDEDCRVHGVGNLFLAGSSVFPTSGYANPTLTIVALATRLADRIKREMRGPVALGADGCMER
jgi:choline dehydrogenase-like flavoprotein